MQSAVIDTDPNPLVIKTKGHLKRLASELLPSNRRFRVLTKPQDARTKGFAVALMEEVGTNGELVFLTGGANLSMVGRFLKVKVEAGELK